MKIKTTRRLRLGASAMFLAVGLLSLLGLAHPAAADGRSVSYFFPADDIYGVRVSPGGDWVVALATDGERKVLLGQRIDGEGVEGIARFSGETSDIQWVDDNTFLIGSGSGIARRWSFVTLRPGSPGSEEGDFAHEIESIWVPGFPVSTLPYEEDQLIWAISYNDESTIHRVSREQLMRHSGQFPNLGRRGNRHLKGQIASLEGRVEWWVVTPEGVPLAAKRYEADASRTVFHRASIDEPFRIIGSYQGKDRDLIKPFGMTADGNRLIVSAYNGRDTIGIYEFDPATRTIEDEIFHRPDVSVDWVDFDPLTHDVQSFTFTSGTETRRHYLDASRDRYASRLGPDAPPLEQIRIVSSTADRGTFVYQLEGPTEPGRHVLRISDRDETIAIGQTGAGIRRERLASAVTFDATSADGTVVEAILTLAPATGTGPSPLIVMPHGGPIGVGDRLSFDPIAQYFASWGFSILQVNYRGSSGYGVEFEKAGRHQWARGIEDDIDAAISVATARADIDGDRLCIMGGSYGGFSALASVIRHPGRFRCAISINGVTDVPMLAETSDTADSEEALSWFRWLLGDPDRDRDELMAISPTYGLAEARTPIMMIYGEEDRRVDSDHAERVLALLELYGHEHEELRLEEVGHGFDTKTWVVVLPEILGFVEQRISGGQSTNATSARATP